MRLGAKLTLWVLIPLLLVLMTFTFVTLQREREVHQREVREEAERIANTLAISVTDALRRRSPPTLIASPRNRPWRRVGSAWRSTIPRGVRS